MKTPWHPLEHQVYSQLQALELQGKTLILAVSGGPDSMALMSVLARLASALEVQIHVAHFHHGQNPNFKRQTGFRNRAQKLVVQTAKSWGLKCTTNRPKVELKKQSEAELREQRYRFLRGVGGRDGWSAKLVVTAHHAQDLLETRLINLLRGSGFSGLQSLNLICEGCEGLPGTLRPFLGLTLTDLRKYILAHDIPCMTDPSNAKAETLRNWLRLKWLPQLNEFRPGSVAALARSLELLSEGAGSESSRASLLYDGQLDRRGLKALPRPLQSRAIVEFLRHHRISSYTKAHVDEILKRLDTSRKQLNFALLKHQWIADAERVRVSRVGTVD